jgi:phenylalanyl-tRNA synthetase beta chain
MGGARSEVSPDTVNVLMEAASWDPPTIMYMSRRHGLRSEASTRFERGVDPNLTDVANARAAAMVVEMAGGDVPEGVIDEQGTPVTEVTVSLAPVDVERLLGPGFSTEEVGGILTRLGMTVEGDETLSVTVPTFRPDVTRPADLVEEVARIHGYERFDATVPTGPAGGLTRSQTRLRGLHQALAGAGLSQAVTLPFVNVDDLGVLWPGEGDSLLRVVNPLREEEATLRPSLLPGLLAALRFNISHGAHSVALFETARVFTTRPGHEDPRLPEQVDRLAWVIIGSVGPAILGGEPHRAGAGVSLALARHVLAVLGHSEHVFTPAEVPGYHPGRGAALSLGGVPIGHVGELSPRVGRALGLQARVAVAEMDLAPLLAPVEPVQAISPSMFPHVDFDLSFLVPSELVVGDLIRATVGAGEGLVESARVFDVFRGPGVDEGSQAIAINYRLRSDDHTLSNEEVQPVRQAMIAAAETLGARLRGM